MVSPFEVDVDVMVVDQADGVGDADAEVFDVPTVDHPAEQEERKEIVSVVPYAPVRRSAPSCS